MKLLLISAYAVALISNATLAATPDSKPQKYRGYTEFHPRAKKPAFTAKKRPILCFDQAHHNLAIEKGFYQPVLELLESDGFVIQKLNEAPFTKKSLAPCTVLYSSASLGHSEVSERELAQRSSFADSEIQVIKTWVQKGGSLLLMTDHQPMSQAAAPLLKEFGVSGSLGNISDSVHPVAPFKDSGIFEITDQRLSAVSPIIRGRNESERICRVYFFYGQALASTSETDFFMKASPSASITKTDEQAEASIERFSALALALKIKKGRLVVFGDATVFTSKLDLELNEKTGINRDGSDNVQLALNVFHWLARVF